MLELGDTDYHNLAYTNLNKEVFLSPTSAHRKGIFYKRGDLSKSVVTSAEKKALIGEEIKAVKALTKHVVEVSAFGGLLVGKARGRGYMK
jgi:hypothetical protein